MNLFNLKINSISLAMLLSSFCKPSFFLFNTSNHRLKKSSKIITVLRFDSTNSFLSLFLQERESLKPYSSKFNSSSRIKYLLLKRAGDLYEVPKNTGFDIILLFLIFKIFFF
jgi:hypothetical protein